MTESEAYTKLLNDPVWGSECKMMSELPESMSARPAIVGGAVRDLLIGRPITDLDIATAVPGSAGMLAEAFANVSGRKLIEYTHEQTIYRVAAHDAPQVDFTDPVGGTRESDLRRRDFTINALAMGLVGDEQGVLIDPVDGLADIESGIIRMTSPDVFDDDPLRLLRAFRFSAQLGFSIDNETLKAIGKRTLLLREVAGERIQLELPGILEPDGSAEQVSQMDSVGLLRPLFPDLARQKGMEQNDYHHLDVWEHTLEALRQIERVFRLEEEKLNQFGERITEYIGHVYPSGHSRRALIKLAVLLHDIAKPHCREVREDGRVTFIGHERKGSDMCMEHFTRLKFPGYERDFVCQIIEGHLRPGSISHEGAERPRVAYRFFRDYDDASAAIILMSLADRLAAQGESVTEKVNEKHRDTTAYLLDCLYNRTELVVRPPQLIDGGTLLHQLGLEPGPMIGHLLNRVQEAQVMGSVRTKEEALEFCRGIIDESV